MEAFKYLLQPLSGSAVSSGVMDATKLVVLGGTVETARRVSSSAWNSFINSFYLTAHFSEEDYPFDWLMNWLGKQPAWSRSREFETTTVTVTASGHSNRRGVTGDEFEDDVEDRIEEDDGRPRLKVVFQPTFDTTHTIYYKGHWLRVRRSKKTDGSEIEMLTISVVARSNNILKQLVLQAKREYEQDCIHRVQIYFADQHGSWRWTDSRHKRPLSSIVLNPGVKEMLLADAKDFLRSEKWYMQRGLPYRRGYLLFGVPGSGKTSLIHAIAGELALDIYVVSLSASWINDSTLTSLLGRIPARSILLLEDLDAAFTRSTSRDSDSTGTPDKEKIGPEEKDKSKENDSKNTETNTLSLSGLLNALDGMQASESRILFATTNHLDRLDPALSRPGRMDVWIEFKNASKWQAEGLFKNFFPSAEELMDDEAATASSASTASEATESNQGAITSNDKCPTLEESINGPLNAARLAELAKMFSEAIPEDEFSVAALQGYLLKNKTRPEAAAKDAGKWVITERELRERLAREKEEKQQKEQEAREKRRKEREEQKAKEELEKENKLRADREERERKEKEEREAKAKRETEERKVATQKAEEEAKASKANSNTVATSLDASVSASEDGFEKVDQQ